MSNITIFDGLRLWIASIGFRIFLWTNQMTEMDYFYQIAFENDARYGEALRAARTYIESIDMSDDEKLLREYRRVRDRIAEALGE